MTIKYAEIFNGVVRFTGSFPGNGSYLPSYENPSNHYAVNITNVTPEPKENWTYNKPNNTFTEPVVIEEVIIPKPITVLAFLRRFDVDERVAIRSSTDPYVIDFVNLLDKAQEVSNVDIDTVAGMQYLVSVNLLTQERANEILEWH